MDNVVNRILDGEDVRDVLMPGIEVVEETAVFEMAKIMSDLANKAITGPIPGFIYFSYVLDAHGPRVKFYGGSKETRYTQTAPSYTFGVDGAQEPKIQSWMNKTNCPNAFDKDCLQQVHDFINNHLALLLLTWFGYVDDAYVQNYFEGHVSFVDLISYIDATDEQKEKISKCKTEAELYKVCKALDMYKF